MVLHDTELQGVHIFPHLVSEGWFFFFFFGKNDHIFETCSVGFGFFFFFFLSPKVIYLFLDVGEDLTVVI